MAHKRTNKDNRFSRRRAGAQHRHSHAQCLNWRVLKETIAKSQSPKILAGIIFLPPWSGNRSYTLSIVCGKILGYRFIARSIIWSWLESCQSNLDNSVKAKTKELLSLPGKGQRVETCWLKRSEIQRTQFCVVVPGLTVSTCELFVCLIYIYIVELEIKLCTEFHASE